MVYVLTKPGFLAMHLMLEGLRKRTDDLWGKQALRYKCYSQSLYATITTRCRFVALAYINRYIRLTVVLGIALLFYMFIVPLMGSGPHWNDWKVCCRIYEFIDMFSFLMTIYKNRFK